MPEDSQENEILYLERYCAFIDILGFREIVSQLDRGKTHVLTLIRLLGEIHQPKRGLSSLANADLRVQSISDAVAISAAPTPEGLAQLFLATDALTIKLLSTGYFIRGAIAKGRLYHDDNMIFGEALVRAYQFESQIARYARLLITRDVKIDVDSYLKDHKYAELFEDRVRQANDVPFYSNSLRDIALAATMIDPKMRFGTTAIGSDLFDIQAIIQRRLDEAADNPRHFEKVQWFASYWNDVMPRNDDLPKIKGPGLVTLFAVE